MYLTPAFVFVITWRQSINHNLKPYQMFLNYDYFWWEYESNVRCQQFFIDIVLLCLPHSARLHRKTAYMDT